MTEELNNEKSFPEAVLKKIKAGRVQMRPRWHFVFGAALVATGLAIGVLTLFYLASFIFFILHQTGVWFLPAFGLRGVTAFLLSLPWLLILAGIVFTILVEILVRHYAFGYRKPLLYSLLAIIIFTLIASAVIAKTSLHENFFLRARAGRLPIAGSLYRDYGLRPLKDIHIGLVTELTADGFRLETRQGDSLLVIVTAETRFPRGVDFQKGDRVVVLGKQDNGGISALGIRRIGLGQEIQQRLPRNRGWFRPVLK